MKSLGLCAVQGNEAHDNSCDSREKPRKESGQLYIQSLWTWDVGVGRGEGRVPQRHERQGRLVYACFLESYEGAPSFLGRKPQNPCPGKNLNPFGKSHALFLSQDDNDLGRQSRSPRLSRYIAQIEKSHTVPRSILCPACAIIQHCAQLTPGSPLCSRLLLIHQKKIQ